jgi:hypothetical protein
MKYLFTLFFLGALMLDAQAQDILLLKTNGKVVIGDTSVISTPGSYNLYVQNGVLTERVKVALENTTQWSDHAFSLTPTLEMVKKSIQNNSHLYDMPSASELVKEGYELQSMDAKILAQVEWLWQHTINLSEENKKLKQELERLKRAINPNE